MYQRIISLAPSNTEILYALKAEDNLVAVTRYCDFPDEAKKKPKIGGWLDINDDLVKSYNPDLILTSTFVQNKINKKYKKMGMNIVAVMPTTLKGVFSSIIKIGKLVSKEKNALYLVDLIKNKINEIKNKIQQNKINKPRVYVEEWHKPPTVSGNWVPTLVKMAGGDYRLIKAGTHSKEITAKQIQNYDPEIIIVSICGMADKVPKEWITKRDGWQNLSAVKPQNSTNFGSRKSKDFLGNNKVYVFDDSWLNRPGPRLTIGLENLAKVIHPECFW